MFFPGETITHQFVIPFAANEIDKVVFSYKQKEAVMFEKEIVSGFEATDEHVTTIQFQLSQGEGLLFADNTPFTIQLNVYTKQGTRHTSHELSSSSGVQYLREVLSPEPLRIVSQPENCVVQNIGDVATFKVAATGTMKYQWEYNASDEWKPCTDGTEPEFHVVATQERINTHLYRCTLMGTDGGQLATHTVRIIYIDRSDE